MFIEDSVGENPRMAVVSPVIRERPALRRGWEAAGPEPDFSRVISSPPLTF